MKKKENKSKKPFIQFVGTGVDGKSVYFEVGNSLFLLKLEHIKPVRLKE